MLNLKEFLNYNTLCSSPCPLMAAFPSYCTILNLETTFEKKKTKNL